MKFCPHCQGTFEDRDQACPRDGHTLLPELAELTSSAQSMVGCVLEHKYRIDSVLGSGGMAFVLRATHLFLDRTVAIKILKPELLTVPELRRRFLREAQSAAESRNPGIVEILDFGVTGSGIYYIVMELLIGENLFQYMRRRGILSMEEAAGIAIGILDALQAVHERGIVHRDVKPDNFVLQAGGTDPQVKLVDFGLAKVFEEKAGQGRERITRGSVVLGSPHHMSPEQARGLPLDARSDIYAVGCMLYEMCTGRVPFEGSNSVEVMSKQLVEEVTPPSAHQPDMDPDMEAVILGCLAKEPDQRFESAAEMSEAILTRYPEARSYRPTPVASVTSVPGSGTVEDLAAIVDDSGEPTPVRFAESRSGRRSWPVWALVVSLAVAAVVMTALYMGGPGPDEAASPPVVETPATQAAHEPAATPPVEPRSAVPVAAPPQSRRIVKVLLKSRPANAVVRDAEGVELGRTPLELAAREGDDAQDYTLVLDGHGDAAIRVPFDGDGERTVELKKLPTPRKKARRKKRHKKLPTGFIDPFANKKGGGP